MAEPFDIGKLLRGFNFLSGEKLGKIIYYAVIATVVGLILWAALIRPHGIDKSSQQAQGDIINIEETKATSIFKIKLLGVWVGIGIE